MVRSNPSTTTQMRLWDDLIYGRLPLTPAERTLGGLELFLKAWLLGLNPLSLLLGAYMALYTSLQPGLALIGTGLWLGSGLMSVANGLAQRYGLDGLDSWVPLLGRFGVRWMAFLYAGILCCQMTSLLQFAGQMLAMGTSHLWPGQPTWLTASGPMLAVFVAWLMLHVSYERSHAWYAQGTAMFFMLLVLLLWQIATALPFGESLRSSPLTWRSDSRTSAIQVVEHTFGFALVWIYPMARLQRQATSKRQGLWGAWLGFFLGAGLTSGLGLSAALLYRNANPIGWLHYLGSWPAIVGCAGILSWTSLVHSHQLLHHAQSTLRLIPVCKQESPWRLSTVLMGGMGLLVWHPTFSSTLASTFGTVWLSILGPLLALVVVDYLGLRKQTIDLTQIFEQASTGKYHYYQGYNLCALWAIACGSFINLRLHPPFSLTIDPLAKWTGGLLPAVMVTFVLYGLLQRFVLMPQQRGGYQPGPIPMRLFQSDLES